MSCSIRQVVKSSFPEFVGLQRQICLGRLGTPFFVAGVFSDDHSYPQERIGSWISENCHLFWLGARLCQILEGFVNDYTPVKVATV